MVRTRTGGGCCPRSAPPPRCSTRNRLNVAINDVWVCKNGSVGEDRDLVDMRYREVRITADLSAGTESAVIWANDLTADYVHENSAYSS
ncbi:Arginine biosynthesis bifunctional protein ArgJ, chloroplastic [Streptomyces rimosus subsp. rimosus]